MSRFYIVKADFSSDIHTKIHFQMRVKIKGGQNLAIFPDAVQIRMSYSSTLNIMNGHKDFETLEFGDDDE